MIEHVVLNKDIYLVWGPLGLWALLGTLGCVKLWQAYSRVQEQRLVDAKEMRDTYHRLVEEIHRTLETLIQVGKR